VLYYSFIFTPMVELPLVEDLKPLYFMEKPKYLITMYFNMLNT